MTKFFSIDDDGIVHLVDYFCEEGDTYDGSNGYSWCGDDTGFTNDDIFHELPGSHSVCSKCVDHLRKLMKDQEKRLVELRKLYTKVI